VCRNDIFDIPGIVELLSLLKIIENQASIIDMERVLNIKQSFRQNKISDAFMDLCFHEPLNFFEAYNNIRESVSLQGSSQDFSCLFSFMESLKEMQDAVQSMSVAEKLSYISQTPDLKTFFKDQPEQQKGLNQLLKLAYETSSTIDFISDITLKTDIDMYHPEAQKVTLMTIHASKGLEFPVVFIAGCEKGFLPMVHASAKILDIDEERRLFYVAMTRAKEVLCLTNASKRIIFGEKTDRSPSPFLKDIEYWLKVSRVFIQDRNSHKRKSTEKQLELF
jgi:superfamily I DNA/RNA helicase